METIHLRVSAVSWRLETRRGIMEIFSFIYWQLRMATAQQNVRVRAHQPTMVGTLNRRANWHKQHTTVPTNNKKIYK